MFRWRRGWQVILAAFARWDRSAIGIKGERLARRWLCRRGYRLVRQNLRLGADEVDLLMWAPKRQAIVLVEVKTRVIPDGDRGQRINPLDGLTPAKQMRQRRAAGRLLSRVNELGVPLRFDVVSVRLPTHGKPVITHHVAAFDGSR